MMLYVCVCVCGTQTEKTKSRCELCNVQCSSHLSIKKKKSKKKDNGASVQGEKKLIAVLTSCLYRHSSSCCCRLSSATRETAVALNYHERLTNDLKRRKHCLGPRLRFPASSTRRVTRAPWRTFPLPPPPPHSPPRRTDGYADTSSAAPPSSSSASQRAETRPRGEAKTALMHDPTRTSLSSC